jgi:hypothetical protein
MYTAEEIQINARVLDSFMREHFLEDDMDTLPPSYEFNCLVESPTSEH